jgi:hypothetical protein
MTLWGGVGAGVQFRASAHASSYVIAGLVPAIHFPAGRPYRLALCRRYPVVLFPPLVGC